MRVVALDLSLTATGVADSERPLEPRVLSPPRGQDRGMARLMWFVQETELVTRKADLVVIEGYAYGAKGSAVISLGELGGVVRLGLYSRGRTYVDVPPPVLKTIATGKGNTKKEAVLAEAIRRLGYRGSDNNCADAMWLMQAARIHYGLPGAPELPQGHRRGIGKIAWPDPDQLTRRAA